MKKILFLYYMEPKLEDNWGDGLSAALDYLLCDFEIYYQNLYSHPVPSWVGGEYDFVLGWGGFNSPVDKSLYEYKKNHPEQKMGLCIGGNAFPVRQDSTYDALYYETSWYADQVDWHPNATRAFGINTKIFKDHQPYHQNNYESPLYDYASIGSFSNWKRHHLLEDKQGHRICIGQFQEGNMPETTNIIKGLLSSGVVVGDMVDPYTLATLINNTHCIYIPANIVGGGERILWEARACGVKVEIEPDNPKLQSLMEEPVLSYIDYAEALKEGINKCLK